MCQSSVQSTATYIHLTSCTFPNFAVIDSETLSSHLLVMLFILPLPMERHSNQCDDPLLSSHSTGTSCRNIFLNKMTYFSNMEQVEMKNNPTLSSLCICSKRHFCICLWLRFLKKGFFNWYFYWWHVLLYIIPEW